MAAAPVDTQVNGSGTRAQGKRRSVAGASQAEVVVVRVAFCEPITDRLMS